MKQYTPFIDSLLMVSGVTYSLANIEHILGIVILIVQIVWFGIKIYIKIKEMAEDGITIDEIEEIEEETKDFVEEVKNGTDTEQR